MDIVYLHRNLFKSFMAIMESMSLSMDNIFLCVVPLCARADGSGSVVPPWLRGTVILGGLLALLFILL